jgi:hypothetical protein
MSGEEMKESARETYLPAVGMGVGRPVGKPKGPDEGVKPSPKNVRTSFKDGHTESFRSSAPPGAVAVGAARVAPTPERARTT